MIIEICTDSLEGAMAAQKYGAKRIELCAALSLGGLTPSSGLIHACSQVSGLETHVMIRHKAGGFQYNSADISIMMKDIEMAHLSGATGVVFGVLNDKNELSVENKKLLDLAKTMGLEVTFHRAFDRIENYEKSIAQLIIWGFDRLLTSGLEPKALAGLEVISDLQKNYGTQIEIMAGSGVTIENALEIARSGIKNLHFTARKPIVNIEIDKFSMGNTMIVDEYKIESIINLFR